MKEVASTISQLRRRKFSGTPVFRDIFDEIVRKCIEAGLVTGKLLLTDSTHILANARKDKKQFKGRNMNIRCLLPYSPACGRENFWD